MTRYALALACALAGAAWGSDRVDVNAASADDLADLPGIGQAKAEAIVAWRGMHGGCATLDDLNDVPGIGAATVEMIRSRAYCGAAGEGVAPTSSSGAGHTARPPATAMPAKIDVNRAPVEVLMTLPGFYRERAEAVVAERERGGPFASCDDLASRVPGIGRATVAAIARICVTD